MTATTSSIRSSINHLIETCKDGQEGFRTASEHIEEPNIKTLLAELSLQRSQFAGELQNAAIHLGDKDPENSGSVAGALHRGWINIKGAVTGRDIHHILAECEAGEDSAVKAYRETLELELPGDLRGLVEEQFAKVQSAHDQVKAVRDTTAR